MDLQLFNNVSFWVFDLDNTLYHPEADLFSQMNRLMRNYIIDLLGVSAAQADQMCKIYWRDHGTTLAGLMLHHGIAPDPFLDHVHQLDLEHLTPDPVLRNAIEALPGRRIVYTNGSRQHGLNVLEQRGLMEVFDAVYGVDDADYIPKPRIEAFQSIFAQDGLNTANAAMFEDDQRNLVMPKTMGMRTILVHPKPEHATETALKHVDFVAEDLTSFVAGLADFLRPQTEQAI